MIQLRTPMPQQRLPQQQFVAPQNTNPLASLKPVSSMFTPNLTYTYNGRLDLDIIQPVDIQLPALSELFRIIQGVRCGDYIHFISELTSALSVSSGDCSPVYTQAGSITDKQLITGQFAVNMSWCAEEFASQCSAITEKYTGMGVDIYDIQANLQSLIFERILQAVKKDIWKVMFFGDNSLGSGSSNIYSRIDGVLTKLLDSETAYCVQPINNATFPNQHNSILAADNARDVLRQLWGQSSIQLMGLPDSQKVFWVTGSVWQNYYDSLINNCCTEGSWRLAQDGTTDLYYRGIKLIPLWFADQTLGAATNADSNPFYDEVRHFAIYTAKNNHYMGVERTSDLDNLIACMDCLTNLTVFKGRMRFGYNFVQCDLISWAK